MKDRNIGALLGTAVEAHRNGNDLSVTMRHVVAHLADTALTAKEIAEKYEELVNTPPTPATVD